MPSDTASTACDPRLEVAPEPQVPKGPGQIRRVPQLFTATARSTPVVPPQVQQRSQAERTHGVLVSGGPGARGGGGRRHVARAR